jgi:hypothetical protein
MTVVASKDTGIVQVNAYQYFGFIGYMSMSYSLQTFSRSPYSGPYSSFPSPIVLQSVSGIPLDTTVLLRNVGVSDLAVGRVFSIDSTLDASVSLALIPPYGSAQLRLRLTQRAPGAAIARAVIVSNSPSSPDTITVTSTTRPNIFARFDKTSIDFGEFLLSRGSVDTTLLLTNSGTSPLIISTVWSTYPWFSLTVPQGTLLPGNSLHCTIRLAPSVPFKDQRVSGDVVVVSNSLSSPDVIHLTVYAIGGILSFKAGSINFGTVKTGESADATCDVTAVGFLPLLNIHHSVTSGSAFAILGACPSVLGTYDSFKDVIRFSPLNPGSTTGVLTYYARSAIGWDTVATAYTISLSGIGTGIAIPGEFFLGQNYPNPFNPRTTIQYGLPHPSSVTLKVYNTLGQEVAVLVGETQEAGYHDVQFDGSGLASGVYFYRLRAGEYVASKRLILVR